MENWILFPVGIAIATIASMLGIGGGIVWVPFLILAMDMEPKKAIMLSFFIQAVGMGSAVFTFVRKGLVFYSLAFSLLPFLFIGLFSGAFLSQRVADDQMLKLALGIFSMAVAIYFAFQVESYNVSFLTNRSIKAPNWLKAAGVFIGSVSGFLSIGVGDSIIPVLRTKLRMPMQNAVGTALILNFLVSIVGGGSHVFFGGHYSPDLLLLFGYGACGVFIGAQIGSNFSQRIQESRLKELFIFLLLMIGLHMIYSVL